jgi:hypothetical protein
MEFIDRMQFVFPYFFHSRFFDDSGRLVSVSFR